VEEGLSEVQSAVEEFGERQKETIELVQGHFEGLADTIRDAEEKIRSATDEAVERLVDEPAYPSSLRNAIARIEDTVEALYSAFPERAAEEGSREDAVDVDSDEFYEKAREYVVEKKKASTALLQRKFKIGYGRAARLIGVDPTLVSSAAI
jgi:DNA segregation ATPase FtsK/SpoIIIE-like protein